MPIYVKVNNTYKVVYNVWQKIAGNWVECKTVWNKFGGQWKVTHIGVEPFIFSPTLTGTITDYNLRAAAVSAGWDTLRPIIASVTLNNCTMRASSAAVYAFSTGFNFPQGSLFTLTVNSTSRIIGGGGKGADGGADHLGQITFGGNGGPAVFTSVALTIVNNGIIGGGGGGGGCGSTQSGDVDDGAGGVYTDYAYGGGGGGGGGYGLGGGTNGIGYVVTLNRFGSAMRDGYISGDQGGNFAGGAGGWGLYIYGASAIDFAGQEGGEGGSLGSAGANGWSLAINVRNGFAGGSAGSALVGNTLITYSGIGTRYGAILP